MVETRKSGQNAMESLELIWVLAEKDLRIEFRTRQAFLSTLFFALLVLIVFQFAFDPGSSATRQAAPGILWVALLFPGIIQLNRSFQSEMEEGTLYGIILSPISRGTFFLGKFLANWSFLITIDLLILVLFIVSFNFPFKLALLWMVLLIFLASAGFTAVGTLFAAMVSSVATREVLLPILLLPILIPLILAAVNGTQEVLLREEFRFLSQWIKLLVAFDVIFLAASFLVIDYVVGD